MIPGAGGTAPASYSTSASAASCLPAWLQQQSDHVMVPRSLPSCAAGTGIKALAW